MKKSNITKNILVDVKDLTKTYYVKPSFIGKSYAVKACDNVSFTIEKGTTYGLVGESGSGKTTLSRSILRLIEPDEGKIYINNIAVHDLKSRQLREFRKNMQLVFQDPYGSLNPRMSVGRIITEALQIHYNYKKKQLNDKMYELLDLVGLDKNHATRFPHEFSGGQRQRICIARALALNPIFMVLDEPVSALDVSIQSQILNLLLGIQQKFSLTYFLVAHNLSVVKYMSHKIGVMYLGKIVEESTSEKLYKNPLHPYTQSLIKSIPEIVKRKRRFYSIPGEIPSPENPPTGCYFHPRCKYAMEKCKKYYPETKIIDGVKVSCFLY